MRRAALLAEAGLVELAAHYLSLSWGLALLVILFLITGIRLTASAAKVADVEARHNALVVSVGAVKDTADAASTTAGNALPKSGGTITGGLTVNGDHHIGGTLYGSGGALAIGDDTTISANAAVTGTFYGSGGPGGPLHVDSAVTVDTINTQSGLWVGGNGMSRQSAPGTSLTTLSDCINCCVATINKLKSTGWFY
jgi:hypothetical protein